MTQPSEQPAARPAAPSAAQLLGCRKVWKRLLSFLQISKRPKRKNPLTKAAAVAYPTPETP